MLMLGLVLAYPDWFWHAKTGPGGPLFTLDRIFRDTLLQGLNTMREKVGEKLSRLVEEGILEPVSAPIVRI